MRTVSSPPRKLIKSARMVSEYPAIVDASAISVVRTFLDNTSSMDNVHDRTIRLMEKLYPTVFSKVNSGIAYTILATVQRDPHTRGLLVHRSYPSPRTPRLSNTLSTGSGGGGHSSDEK